VKRVAGSEQLSQKTYTTQKPHAVHRKIMNPFRGKKKKNIA
jgi:hypothetical protein